MDLSHPAITPTADETAAGNRLMKHLRAVCRDIDRLTPERPDFDILVDCTGPAPVGAIRQANRRHERLSAHALGQLARLGQRLADAIAADPALAGVAGPGGLESLELPFFSTSKGPQTTTLNLPFGAIRIPGERVPNAIALLAAIRRAGGFPELRQPQDSDRNWTALFRRINRAGKHDLLEAHVLAPTAAEAMRQAALKELFPALLQGEPLPILLFLQEHVTATADAVQELAASAAPLDDLLRAITEAPVGEDTEAEAH